MFKHILIMFSLVVVWMMQQLYEVHIFGNMLIIFPTRDDTLAAGFLLYPIITENLSGFSSPHLFYAISCIIQAFLVFQISKSGFFALFVLLLSFGFGGIKVLLMLLGITYGHPTFGDLQFLVSLIVQFFSLPLIPILMLLTSRYLSKAPIIPKS